MGMGVCVTLFLRRPFSGSFFSLTLAGGWGRTAVAGAGGPCGSPPGRKDLAALPRLGLAEPPADRGCDSILVPWLKSWGQVQAKVNSAAALAMERGFNCNNWDFGSICHLLLASPEEMKILPLQILPSPISLLKEGRKTLLCFKGTYNKGQGTTLHSLRICVYHSCHWLLWTTFHKLN